MGDKKNRLKRGLVLVLTLALVGNGMSQTMSSVLAQDNEPAVETTNPDKQEDAANNLDANQGEAERGGQGTEAGTEDKTSALSSTDETESDKSKETVEAIIPIADQELPDNNELFAGYVDQLFFGDLNGSISLLGEFGNSQLKDADKEIYTQLKAKIKAIAAGEQNSTKDVQISTAKTWTLAELGIDSASDNESVKNAIRQKFAEDMDAITSYLLMDCPYDLYWFDKSASGGIGWSYGLYQEGADYGIKDLEFSFAVAEGYQAGDAYHIDTSKIAVAKKAADAAKQIIEENAEKSDYEKLEAYSKKICDLVSYNSSAASAQTPYGDPWQLIWVFDDDPTTNVVCEGYSKAFQYLCDLSVFSRNTVCYTVTGIMSGGTGAGPHMWNIVTLEGSNYLVDVTNCDTGTVGEPDQLFLAGTNGSVQNGYTFNLNQDISYKYDSDQAGLFGEGILTLASSKYVQKEELRITFPTAEKITYGDSVGSSVLQGGRAVDAAGNLVAGTFDWADDVKDSGYGDAGTKTLQVQFTPDDTDTYSVQTASVTVTVAQKPITVTADAKEKKYGTEDPALTYAVEGLVEPDQLSGELGREAGEDVKADGYAINQGTLKNDNYQIVFTGNLLKIVKADYTGKTEEQINTRYGNRKEFDLKTLLQAGAQVEAVLGEPDIKDEAGIFAEAPTIDDNKVLSYQLNNDSNLAGHEAVITIPVETRNYNMFNITIKVVVSPKLEQDSFKFDAAGVNKAYGDSDFIVAAQGAAEGSTVTYESADPTIAVVDETSGNVHILKKGTVTITATASETDEYVGAMATCTLTISPKTLTWDVSGLQAVDKVGTVTDKKASLYGELRVSGIITGDIGKVSFICPAEKLTGTYANTTAGSQKVTLNWGEDGAIGLTGTDTDNYTLPSELPEITGRINAVKDPIDVPESTDTVKYRLEVEEGISQIPEALKENEELNTPAKIEEKMKAVIRAKLTGESNQNSIEVYDVVLMIQTEDGTWVTVTEDNFPADGVTVTLPYPEGTGKDTHDFEIAHMFTHTLNGHTAGDIEYPAPTKTDNGIEFKVTSLSPVAVGWKEIKADNNGANGNAANTSTSGRTSPQTGDENTIMLYVLLMMLGAAGIGFTMKRKMMR